VALQTWPPPQLAPIAAAVHAVVLALGAHVWQALTGFAAPGAWNDPAMKQPAVQLEALHTTPAPQLVPLALLVHAVVLDPGVQSWHALPGLAAPGG
jgi:hypothetical protein